MNGVTASGRKKVILAKDLQNLFAEKGLFRPGDVFLHIAATNDDVFRLHQKEHADLIISKIDLPGIKSEALFEHIRNDEGLRDVAIILICKDTLAIRQRCRLCRANTVFTLPVDTALLDLKVRQFLNIEPRKAYRAVLALAIQGKFRDRPRPFWTENISASGMLIKSEEPLENGEGIFFSFFLANGAHVAGYGEIARIVQVNAYPEEYLYGIKFTDVDPEVRAELSTAVRS